MAHPDVYPYPPEKLLSDFKSAGGDGVEVYYDYARNRPEIRLTESGNEKIIGKYRKIAAGLDLLESGGSDFHGGLKGDDEILGRFGIPSSAVDIMRRRLFSN